MSGGFCIPLKAVNILDSIGGGGGAGVKDIEHGDSWQLDGFVGEFQKYYLLNTLKSPTKPSVECPLLTSLLFSPEFLLPSVLGARATMISF